MNARIDFRDLGTCQVPGLRERTLTKEELAKNAAAIFRLLRAFRSIKDRAVRLHVVEVVEAMAESRTVSDAKAGTERQD